jgi:uncharacterized protein YqeY
MSLKEKVDAEIKNAMRAKDQDALRALRGIKSMILLAETEGGQVGELSAEREMQLLNKAVKQRKESAETYTAQNRQDLADKELVEVAIIEKFLPAQLSDEDLLAAVKAIVAQVGATSAKDMGKVMGAASKQLAGKADNKRVADAVKAALGSI